MGLRWVSLGNDLWVDMGRGGSRAWLNARAYRGGVRVRCKVCVPVCVLMGYTDPKNKKGQER